MMIASNCTSLSYRDDRLELRFKIRILSSPESKHVDDRLMKVHDKLPRLTVSNPRSSSGSKNRYVAITDNFQEQLERTRLCSDGMRAGLAMTSSRVSASIWPLENSPKREHGTANKM